MKWIRKLCALLLIVTVTGIALARPMKTSAGGTIFSSEYTQAAQTEARAVIMWDGKRETILDSMTFTVNPLVEMNFAWVIPVPTKPQVELVKDDVLAKIEQISQKKISKNTWWQKLLFWNVEEEKNVPTSVYSRPINNLNVEVFGPQNQIQELSEWLKFYGYFIPKEARSLLKTYEDNGWYFVTTQVDVSHLQSDSTESLTVPGGHTLPVKIEFDTDTIVYPLKFASIQPDYDSQGVPISFAYGTKSQDILGETDQRLDDVLSEQSKNQWPRLPLDYNNEKVELFVFAPQKMSADGFTTTYANQLKHPVEFKNTAGEQYLGVPQQGMWLTRMFTYRPMVQMDDITLKPADDTRRVNDR